MQNVIITIAKKYLLTLYSMITTIDLLSDDPKVVEEIKSLMSAPYNFKKGPSAYFHHKAIEYARNEEEFLEDRHLEYIYATLASWGMHRMGPKGAKMPEFEDFKSSIQAHKPFFDKVKSKTINNISHEEFEEILDKLKTICFGQKPIQATTSVSKLVSSTKTLAHILPDLVPPIDRQYTLKFFYGIKNHLINNDDSGRKVFEDVMRYMYKVYSKNCQFERLASNIKSLDKCFCGSLPKIFDNVVINCTTKGIRLNNTI